MCNLYEHKQTWSALRDTLQGIGLNLTATSQTGNLAPQERIYADQDAPIIRHIDDGAELAMIRWGFPGIPRKGKDGQPLKPTPITNIRNLESRWWSQVNREYLIEKAYRCLVPFTAFSEPHHETKQTHWFKPSDEEQVCFFAGIWRPWSGERLLAVDGKKRRQRVEQNWELFSFLTTAANEIIAPVHPKAMPVILSAPEELEEWLAGGEASLQLQKSAKPELELST